MIWTGNLIMGKKDMGYVNTYIYTYIACVNTYIYTYIAHVNKDIAYVNCELPECEETVSGSPTRG